MRLVAAPSFLGWHGCLLLHAKAHKRKQSETERGLVLLLLLLESFITYSRICHHFSPLCIAGEIRPFSCVAVLCYWLLLLLYSSSTLSEYSKTTEEDITDYTTTR